MVIWKYVSAFFIKLTLAVCDFVNQIRSKTISDNGKGLIRNGNSKAHHLRPEDRFAYIQVNPFSFSSGYRYY